MRTTRRQWLASAAAAWSGCAPRREQRPNILFAISDDQSFPHTSAAGDRVVRTPAFDRVAERGVLFTNAISNSPGCAPSRAAILTGRSHWQLEEAGTHASYFPARFEVYPDLLARAGYHVGHTGKGAGPANFEGWKHNPAGPPYQQRQAPQAPEGVSRNDYAENFADFLKARPAGAPFAFWFGATEPHRPYKPGIGRESGKRIDDVVVPPFLPDAPEVRSDMLDYYFEIEHFDRHLGRMLDLLEEAGELDNTLVVVTSDNGMAFPRAKATLYEYGIHLPLAVCWPARVPGGRRIEDLISFTDFAPTFLEAAGLRPTPVMTGKSFLDVLLSGKSGAVDPARRRALSGRERHSHARFDNLGYPARALRTREFLYIRNFAPERYPAGDPEGYYDIDGSPTKKYLLENRDKPAVKELFELTCARNPPEQLYRITDDPGCLRNLAGAPEFKTVLEELRRELEITLRDQQDPRVLGRGDIFESYPRFQTMRPELGGFAEQGKYNPKYQL
jgi:uncharacterized sulfatase